MNQLKNHHPAWRIVHAIVQGIVVAGIVLAALGVDSCLTKRAIERDRREGAAMLDVEPVR